MNEQEIINDLSNKLSEAYAENLTLTISHRFREQQLIMVAKRALQGYYGVISDVDDKMIYDEAELERVT